VVHQQASQVSGKKKENQKNKLIRWNKQKESVKVGLSTYKNGDEVAGSNGNEVVVGPNNGVGK